MRKDEIQVEGKPVESTNTAKHWLYANMPNHPIELQREVERLQHTIAALIAAGAVTENKARKAYDIAGQ